MHNVTEAVQAVPLETYGGLIALTRPENVPEGGSPRNYNMDFLVGSAQTRAPLQSVYSFENVATGPNAPDAAVNTPVTGNAWLNPSNILAADSSYAQCVPGAGSDALDVTALSFDLPSTVTPTGVTVKVKGWTPSNAMLTAQLLLGGVPVGLTRSVPLPPDNAVITFGGSTDLWGAAIAFSDVNAVGFGVRLTASSSFPAAQVLLDACTVTVAQTVANANFTFLTTFTAQDGTVKNVCLDADGNFWVENVSVQPGVLTLAFDGVTPGSYASGVSGPDVEYLAFNDLTTGSDIPRQYTANWTDRISQVGPGASPMFAATTNAVGVPANITAYAVASNVVTVTAANSFTAGQAVLFAALGVATFLNGQVLVVLGSGLSGTQFQVEFSTANVSTTPDAGSATPQANFPIATITQLAAEVRPYQYILNSAGPGSTSPGTVWTLYYSDTTNPSGTGPIDQALVDAVNGGNPVYVYIYGRANNANSGAITFGPFTAQVTSVGVGSPPGQPRAFDYFTFVLDRPAAYAYTTAQEGFTSTYQQTLATLTTAEPVPSLNVGSQATIAGTTVAQYNSTWTISQSLNSGSMGIVQTSLVAGVATYSYNVASGANPVAGQLVTISGTLNANGLLNGTDLVIASVAGTNVGTFTVNGFSAAVDYPAQAEAGQATTAGTKFTFDPGPAQVGPSPPASDPIYGNATGGVLIFTGNGQYIGAGTRQGVVFFITRNGYQTAPSAPVTFSCPENTTAILASQIPIGPPNVIARGIAFTEAGANGVPGGNFFTIPTPVQYIVNGVTYTASALVVNDNVSTSAEFTFPDATLLNATGIDIQGNDLFNLIELGNPGWVVAYDSRNAYGLCQNKVQNFTNLSFDGGYLPGGKPVPLGWSAPDAYGSLLVSPVFGNSYYIKNSTGATLATAGLISQAAFQDAYQQPILAPNTAYSVRVTARVPSGATGGNLVVDLVADGVSNGLFVIPFAELTTSMATLVGSLNGASLATIPANLQVRVYATELTGAADVEIDRIEVFPTAIPVLTTTVFFSYAGLPESIDAVTGAVKFVSENQQPVNGARVMYDTFYALKQSSLYSLQASPNLEPSQWNEPEVAQRAGACGINAYDFGEQWIVMASRIGLHLFDGGQPGKIMQEIFQVWDAINWSAGKSIWVRNDAKARRLYVGVPLPTPNFWLPDAAVNENPQTPNVILMLNYQGCENGDAVKTEMQLHVTMFGSLNSTDMKRKWSIWPIACPYAAEVSTGPLSVSGGSGGTGGFAPEARSVFAGGLAHETNVLDTEMRFCNGIASSKIYRLNTQLDPDATPTDDGAVLRSLYTTYGHINVSKAGQMPLLGMFRKIWTYMTHQISGAGQLVVRLLPNVLLGPADDASLYYTWTLPGGFVLTDPCTQIREAPMNFAATRTFVEFSTTGRMNISNLVMIGRKSTHNVLTGRR